MKISTCGAIAAVMATASTLLLAAPASAATGRLVLRGSAPDVVITNPGPGCSSAAFGFSEGANRTNVDVTVYSNVGCTGYGLVVRRGSTTPVGDRHSVLVPS